MQHGISYVHNRVTSVISPEQVLHREEQMNLPQRVKKCPDKPQLLSITNDFT